MSQFLSSMKKFHMGLQDINDIKSTPDEGEPDKVRTAEKARQAAEDEPAGPK